MKTIDPILYDELYKSLSVQTESGVIYPDSDDIEEVIDIVCDYVGFGDKFDFDKISKKIMEYLRTEFHPHTKIIITSTESEIVEGVKCVKHDTPCFKASEIDLEDLFHQFLNYRSDSCSLEASDAERTELEWRLFVQSHFKRV